MTRSVFRHPLFTVEAFPVQTRAGTEEYVRFRMADWVNVVPVTARDEVVLVRQHRWGIGKSTLEIPGGTTDPGESPFAAARRELAEETGYARGRWYSMGAVHPNPAIQDNSTWLYVASGVEPVGERHLDPGEEIEVELHPIASIPQLLRDGAISHALAVVSLQRFLLGWWRESPLDPVTTGQGAGPIPG